MKGAECWQWPECASSVPATGLTVCQPVGPVWQLSSTLPLAPLWARSGGLQKGLVPLGQDAWKYAEDVPVPPPRQQCGLPVPLARSSGPGPSRQGPSVWRSEVGCPASRRGPKSQVLGFRAAAPDGISQVPAKVDPAPVLPTCGWKLCSLFPEATPTCHHWFQQSLQTGLPICSSVVTLSLRTFGSLSPEQVFFF